MQYQKDEIRNRIISSALKEFNDKGFIDASMRQIAKEADVAIGNLYRYFKNKEDLFYAVVDPTYHSFNAMVKHHDFPKVTNISIFEVITESIMPFFREYRTQLLLLIDKSKGTKYENVKKEFILATEKEITDNLLPAIKQRGVNIKEAFIFKVIASTFFEGMLIILRKYNDEDTVRYLIHELLSISFTDIEKRFV